MSEDLIEELLEEEEETTNEPGAKQYTTITELMKSYFNTPVFFFTVETAGGPTKKSRGMVEKHWTISEIMSDSNFNQFLKEDTKQEYLDLLNNPVSSNQDAIGDFFVKVYDDISSVDKQQRIDQGGTFTQPMPDIVITYSKKKTDNGGQFGTYKDQQEAIKSADLTGIVLGEDLQEKAEASQQVDVYNNAVRSSHPTWGYTTTVDGTIKDSTGKEVPAPFWKGNEYSMFTGLDPSDIFILQQKMTRAGMPAPTIEEYGQWTDREANFMSAIFIEAADSGNWEKDKNANVPMYTTTLEQAITDFGQTEDFINLLKEAEYMSSKAVMSPGQIQQALDQVEDILDVTFTPQDYVNYGQLVIQANSEAAALQRKYEDALPSDRDIILNSTFKDVRATKPGEFPRYLKGNTLPLVLPSYEYLMGQQGGELPVVKSSLEILTDVLKARPEVQQQMDANQALQDIQYSTNLFEASMGAIGLGDLP